MFHNLIWVPLGPEAERHLDILRQVPQLLRQIPVRKLTLSEVTHLRFLDELITELARLAACAISRARQCEGTEGNRTEQI